MTTRTSSSSAWTSRTPPRPRRPSRLRWTASEASTCSSTTLATSSRDSSRNFRPEQIESQVRTVLFGSMTITRAALPTMRAQRSGQVVSISSTAGLVGQEWCTAYAAAKFGLEGWMESLATEVEQFGIGTTIVEPGFFRTELLTPESTTWAELSVDDYAEQAAETKKVWQGMNGQQGGDPAKLARGLVRARWIPTSRRHAGLREPTRSTPPKTRRRRSCRRLKLIESFQAPSATRATDADDRRFPCKWLFSGPRYPLRDSRSRESVPGRAMVCAMVLRRLRRRNRVTSRLLEPIARIACETAACAATCAEFEKRARLDSNQ